MRHQAFRSIRARIVPRSSYSVLHLREYSGNEYDVIDKALGEPSWSAQDLLSSGVSTTADEITPTQLRKLLRLSALPPPKDQDEESRLLGTLASQLHFVQAIRNVDTIGVRPLRSLRDESDEAGAAAEITKDSLQENFDSEERIGKHYVRIRRRPSTLAETKEAEDWDPLQCATRKSNRFFVVNGAK
ncbi:DUF726 domain protein [Eremomyces bilateralis CBS 781.70]|uniref:DUF726 domain protein n=1 Tax=Eremomyces bilateralis CBS 781.70 TaxID=1392243 RepID=A0A6G1G388_9PEZI|nr:DUF726 domain protein [Eremomyces bilateralis CBS 781.70]KAF1812524.1 DUF726 domain protein [Eremomyces bilateralis CBS 781.70]